MMVDAATAAERPRTKRRRSIMWNGSFCSARFVAGIACPVYCGAGGLAEDKCPGVGVGGEERAGGFGVEHEDYGGEGVAVGGAGIDDCGLEHAFDGAHGLGIEDMAVAMTVFDEEFFG